MATQGLLQRKRSAAHSPWYANLVGTVSFTVGVEAGNVINVGVQAKTPNGVNVAVAAALPFWLSTLATGLDIVGTAPNSGIAIGTDGLLIEAIADKYGLLVTKANGHADINFSESGTPTFYLALALPDGTVSVSGAVTFA